ncbi:MAG TPA: hypothetical protein PKD00_03315 [Burkholderiales bacterium]|nr:hypothetical protein [Burkholderiales bacterium]
MQKVIEINFSIPKIKNGAIINIYDFQFLIKVDENGNHIKSFYGPLMIEPDAASSLTYGPYIHNTVKFLFDYIPMVIEAYKSGFKLQYFEIHNKSFFDEMMKNFFNYNEFDRLERLKNIENIMKVYNCIYINNVYYINDNTIKNEEYKEAIIAYLLNIDIDNKYSDNRYVYDLHRIIGRFPKYDSHRISEVLKKIIIYVLKNWKMDKISNTGGNHTLFYQSLELLSNVQNEDIILFLKDILLTYSDILIGDGEAIIKKHINDNK